MKTIHVALDYNLLKAVDSAARKAKTNRSALVREALKSHLKPLHIRELEQRDRRGYEANPQRQEEYKRWENAAAWPE